MRKLKLAAILAGAMALCGVGFEACAQANGAALVATSDWRVFRPSRAFKDLPAFRPRETDETPDFGIMQFVCRKTESFVLLVHPAQQMSANTPAQIIAGAAPPVALSFRNLYVSKAPLSKLLDWDAEIYFSEASPSLIAALAGARSIRFELDGRAYQIELDDFGAKWPAFAAYCANGATLDPGAFGK